MHGGPQGQKRPADVIGCAVQVARLWVGIEAEGLREPCGRVRSGLAGAQARKEKLTASERQAIARRASAVRWRT